MKRADGVKEPDVSKLPTLVDTNLRATAFCQGTLLSENETMHFEQFRPLLHSALCFACNNYFVGFCCFVV